MAIWGTYPDSDNSQVTTHQCDIADSLQLLPWKVGIIHCHLLNHPILTHMVFHPILTQVVLGFFHHFMGMIGQTSVKPISTQMFLTIFWPFHGNCWTMSNPSLWDLLVTAPTAEASESIGALWRCNSSSMRRWCSRIASAGNLGKSAENVRHVWDISIRIYDICLLAEDCWECIWGYSRCIYVCVYIYIYTIYTHT
jgi:hypothetical protein